MVEIFTVGGGDYLVNVFQAVAAWTGNGGYKSLLQVVMVMGLALSALTLAFTERARRTVNRGPTTSEGRSVLRKVPNVRPVSRSGTASAALSRPWRLIM